MDDVINPPSCPKSQAMDEINKTGRDRIMESGYRDATGQDRIFLKATGGDKTGYNAKSCCMNSNGITGSHPVSYGIT